MNRNRGLTRESRIQFCRCRHSRALDSPLSADRGNEGRRDANCTDSRRFSVFHRSFQRLPLPSRLALLSRAGTPLSATAATVGHPLRRVLSAQAPRILCGLYPILIHIRVSTVTSNRQDNENFSFYHIVLRFLRITAASRPTSCLFFTGSSGTRDVTCLSTLRTTDNCSDSPYPSLALPLPLSLQFSALLHAPNTFEFFLE